MENQSYLFHLIDGFSSSAALENWDIIPRQQRMNVAIPVVHLARRNYRGVRIGLILHTIH